MNIGSVPAHVFPSIGYAINTSHSGKTSLPVSPQSYIYSHFKHVSGTPAPEGVRGVTISRLKILDTLIEQLTRMKRQPIPFAMMEGKDAEKRINALIEQYQSQIRAASAAGSASLAFGTTGYKPAPPATGAVFSLSV